MGRWCLISLLEEASALTSTVVGRLLSHSLEVSVSDQANNCVSSFSSTLLSKVGVWESTSLATQMAVFSENPLFYFSFIPKH